jgi:two-component sensor histidine kinase
MNVLDSDGEDLKGREDSNGEKFRVLRYCIHFGLLGGIPILLILVIISPFVDSFIFSNEQNPSHFFSLYNHPNLKRIALETLILITLSTILALNLQNLLLYPLKFKLKQNTTQFTQAHFIISILLPFIFQFVLDSFSTLIEYLITHQPPITNQIKIEQQEKSFIPYQICSQILFNFCILFQTKKRKLVTICKIIIPKMLLDFSLNFGFECFTNNLLDIRLENKDIIINFIDDFWKVLKYFHIYTFLLLITKFLFNQITEIKEQFSISERTNQTNHQIQEHLGKVDRRGIIIANYLSKSNNKWKIKYSNSFALQKLSEEIEGLDSMHTPFSKVTLSQKKTIKKQFNQEFENFLDRFEIINPGADFFLDYGSLKDKKTIANLIPKLKTIDLRNGTETNSIYTEIVPYFNYSCECEDSLTKEHYYFDLTRIFFSNCADMTLVITFSVAIKEVKSKPKQLKEEVILFGKKRRIKLKGKRHKKLDTLGSLGSSSSVSEDILHKDDRTLIFDRIPSPNLNDIDEFSTYQNQDLKEEKKLDSSHYKSTSSVIPGFPTLPQIESDFFEKNMSKYAFFSNENEKKFQLIQNPSLQGHNRSQTISYSVRKPAENGNPSVGKDSSESISDEHLRKEANQNSLYLNMVVHDLRSPVESIEGSLDAICELLGIKGDYCETSSLQKEDEKTQEKVPKNQAEEEEDEESEMNKSAMAQFLFPIKEVSAGIIATIESKQPNTEETKQILKTRLKLTKKQKSTSPRVVKKKKLEFLRTKRRKISEVFCNAPESSCGDLPKSKEKKKGNAKLRNYGTSEKIEKREDGQVRRHHTLGGDEAMPIIPFRQSKHKAIRKLKTKRTITQTERRIEYVSKSTSEINYHKPKSQHSFIISNSVKMEINKIIQGAKVCSFTLTNLINDLLDSAKINNDTFHLFKENVNLKHILSSIRQILLFKAISKQIAFTLHFGEQHNLYLLERIYIDSNRIRQIFNNLISNALKFTKRFGTINVSVRVIKILEKFTKPYTPTSSYLNIPVKLVCKVADTGIGIKAQDIPKLFTDFSKLNAQSNFNKTGTGLGLSICKKLVQKMGGDISVVSEEGKGSEFQFSFQTFYNYSPRNTESRAHGPIASFLRNTSTPKDSPEIHSERARKPSNLYYDARNRVILRQNEDFSKLRKVKTTSFPSLLPRNECGSFSNRNMHETYLDDFLDSKSDLKKEGERVTKLEKERKDNTGKIGKIRKIRKIEKVDSECLFEEIKERKYFKKVLLVDDSEQMRYIAFKLLLKKVSNVSQSDNG